MFNFNLRIGIDGLFKGEVSLIDDLIKRLNSVKSLEKNNERTKETVQKIISIFWSIKKDVEEVRSVFSHIKQKIGKVGNLSFDCELKDFNKLLESYIIVLKKDSGKKIFETHLREAIGKTENIINKINSIISMERNLFLEYIRLFEKKAA